MEINIIYIQNIVSIISFMKYLRKIFKLVVRMGRLELPQFYPLEPKSSASTNFATSASLWGDRRGSNPRHPESQSGALPTELRPPLHFIFLLFLYSIMVRLAGFEPATLGLEGRCSIQMSYRRINYGRSRGI